MARTSDPALAQRRRRQILDAALACFRRRGFHQAPMQEICAEAAISPGALYRYFPSKAHLIAAIAEDVQVRIEAILAQADAGQGFTTTLEAVAQVMFEEIFTPGDGSLVADVMAEAARDPDLAARLRLINDQTLAPLVRLIQTARDQGVVADSIDPAQSAMVLMALIDGLGVRQAIDPLARPADSQAAFRDFLHRYFAVKPGVAARRRKSRPEEVAS